MAVGDKRSSATDDESCASACRDGHGRWSPGAPECRQGGFDTLNEQTGILRRIPGNVRCGLPILFEACLWKTIFIQRKPGHVQPGPGQGRHLQPHARPVPHHWLPRGDRSPARWPRRTPTRPVAAPCPTAVRRGHAASQHPESWRLKRDFGWSLSWHGDYRAGEAGSSGNFKAPGTSRSSFCFFPTLPRLTACFIDRA